MFCFKNNFNGLKLSDIYYLKTENANTFILINLLKFNFTFLNPFGQSKQTGYCLSHDSRIYQIMEFTSFLNLSLNNLFVIIAPSGAQ